MDDNIQATPKGGNDADAAGIDTSNSQPYTSETNLSNQEFVGITANDKSYTPDENIQQTAALQSNGTTTGNRTSAALRNLPPHIVMDAPETTLSGNDQEVFQDDPVREKKSCRFNILQKTCLKPEYSLRKQIMLAFGTTITVTILFVMMASVVFTVTTTNTVKSDGREAIVEVTDVIFKSSPRYLSELVNLKIPVESVSIIAEAVMDRFAGYPDHPDYADDSAVPFFDIYTQRNVYPLNSSALPLDWQIEPNVNDANHREHVQNRWSWYGENPVISTKSATYAMQGMCDPSITDPGDPTYFENCSDTNNDMDTGGAVTQSLTNSQIARKAADLNFLLKTIYEQYQDIHDIGIYFANAGAGSVMYFPHYRLNSNGSYKSIGCEWMSQPNPFDKSRPIAPEEEIKRCRPEGVEVNSRAYNVLERDWCRQMALDPFRMHIIGPVFSAWGDGLWYMSVGKAVYDRITNDFIACVAISLSLDTINDIVTGVDILEDRDGGGAKLMVVNWDEKGTVVASAKWDWSTSTEPPTIDNPNLEKGVSKEIFDDIKSVVNFAKKWDPKGVRQKFDELKYETDGVLISAYPLPVPPKEYDENYFPEAMVILSMDKNDLEKTLNEMEEEAHDTQRRLILVIVICGVSGILISFVFISLASNYLTKPLKWMNGISEQILDQFGQYDDKDINYSGPIVFRCSPKTELSALVEEFQKMISRFSGSGSAKVEDRKLIEVKNSFNLFAEFNKLYSSRIEPDYKYSYSGSSSGTVIENDVEPTLDKAAVSQDDTIPSLMVPRRCYLGRNIVKQPEVQKNESKLYSEEIQIRKKRVHSSPLFWWIMGLIVTPLLVTTVLISAIVTWKLSEEFPSLFNTVEDLYIDMEKDYISSTARLRSDFTESATKRGLRELQMLNRVASWLLFGGIEKSSSFTEMDTFVEECKYFESGTCPHHQNKTTAPCDCKWNDFYSDMLNLKCYDYKDHTRYLQKLKYSVQTENMWPNGDRNSTGFPNNSFSPNTTYWLDSAADIPGFNKGSAKGYEHTYDRMRAISALSVIQMPLYNYDQSKEKSLATYVAFEADGMSVGYEGCAQFMADLSYWQSTEANNAAGIRPELCPLGKYGFDARCRDWYATGKRKWQERSTSDSPLYVTAPYSFVVYDSIGQSCTLPLVDQNTNQYIGQTLVDFSSDSIFSAIQEENTILFEGGFSFVITGEGGTVTGPGFTTVTNEIKPPIEKLVIPYDNKTYTGDCVDTDEFETILCDMKRGNYDTTQFTRLKNDSSKETVYISYAPVYVKHFFPLNSSDFSRGVKEYDSLIYSIALVVPETTRFQDSMHTLRGNVNVAIGVLCALIVIGTASVTFVLSRVTVSITTPLLFLLEEMKKVNQPGIHDSSLRFTSNSGSRDIRNICNTFEILVLVVHHANSAYFSGDLEVAYKVLVDNLSAFKRLQNKKAIGVASNNLGNIMLAMYRTMLTSGDETICGMTKQEIISKGTKYFLQAIKLGEETYDQFYEEEGWSKNCLTFMQHLSNRYFNRAIFLLTVRKDHETPDLAEQMAFRDLEIATDMDVEVNDQCIDMGVVRSKKEHFDSIMGRVRGLIELLKLSYTDDWNLEELLEDALKLLKSVVNNPSNDLFSNLGPAGRMQQLDRQLITYIKITGGDLTEAAKIAIRMLVEDEYILSDPYMTAMGTIIEYATSESSVDFLGDSPTLRNELFTMRASAWLSFQEHARHMSSTGSNSLRNLQSISLKYASDERIISSSMLDCNRGDVTMEIF